MKLTKFQMVKEVLFDATTGKRTNANFAEGLDLIDLIGRLCSAESIRYYYNQYKEAEITAEHALQRLVDMAFDNSLGSNGMTETSKRVLSAFHKITN